MRLVNNKRCASFAPLWLALALSLSGCPDVTPTEGLGGEMVGGEAGTLAPPPSGMPSGGEAGIEPIGGVEVGLGFGEACISPAQCDSSICFSSDINADGVCTQSCDNNNNPCPEEGWACQPTTSFGDICVPVDPKGICAPCEADWECGTSADLCIFGACGVACETTDDCPNNFACSPSVGQCVPADGGECAVIEDPDTDGDGVPDAEDNCPRVANPTQANADTDTHGDACDNCALTDNEDQLDSDLDSYGDACDICPEDSDDQLDSDFDGYGDACDTCVSVPNPDQVDSNGNGIGDLCEAPDGVTFTLGGPASAPVQGTAGQYTLLGGSFGARPTLMSNGSYTLHAFPSR